MPRALYIHIPFCIRKCLYCDFVSIPFDRTIAERYLFALDAELGMRESGTLDTLYIGGGTPTIITPEMTKQLFQSIRTNFAIAPSAEVTVEANPGTVNPCRLKLLRDCGVNRISLGVQSLNNIELKTLGRAHTSDEAVSAVEIIKGAGFENFSIDLMYGIPGQTLQDWMNTVQEAISLGPRHISAYELTPEPDTPIFNALAEGSIALPDEDTVIEMFDRADDAFEKAGLRHYEISNYALAGFECRHNLNYWQRGRYVGAGVGAHSFINDDRIENTEDIKEYIEMLEAGKLPIVETRRLTPKDESAERVFLGLRLAEGIEVDDSSRFKTLENAGLIVSINNRIRLTRKGMTVSNAVMVEVMELMGL